MAEKMNEQGTISIEPADLTGQQKDKTVDSEDLGNTTTNPNGEQNPPRDTTESEINIKIITLQQQLEDEHRKLLTTLADMANLRKRTEKEIASARKYALEGFAKDILETVDNLERSLTGSGQQPEALKEFYAGIELTLKSFKEVLTRYDIKEINPLNQPFDHQLHTAISTKPITSEETVAVNTVIEVIQKGYQLKDRLLRPALVVVAQ